MKIETYQTKMNNWIIMKQKSNPSSIFMNIFSFSYESQSR